jgi:hypothetical protein
MIAVMGNRVPLFISSIPRDDLPGFSIISFTTEPNTIHLTTPFGIQRVGGNPGADREGQYGISCGVRQFIFPAAFRCFAISRKRTTREPFFPNRVILFPASLSFDGVLVDGNGSLAHGTVMIVRGDFAFGPGGIRILVK